MPSLSHSFMTASCGLIWSDHGYRHITTRGWAELVGKMGRSDTSLTSDLARLQGDSFCQAEQRPSTQVVLLREWHG